MWRERGMGQGRGATYRKYIYKYKDKGREREEMMMVMIIMTTMANMLPIRIVMQIPFVMTMASMRKKMISMSQTKHDDD